MRAEIVDFWQMVFSPSSLDRIWHVFMGCWQAGAFFVISVSAWYLLKKRHHQFAQVSLKIGLVVAVVASMLQLVSGHSSAQNVAEYQPAKLAAFEGHYAASAPADMYLFGWVDDATETAHGIRLPGMLSFLVHGDAAIPVTGLQSFPKELRPPVNIVFQAYHLMVGIGILLIVLSWLGLFFWWRRTLFEKRGFLWILVFSVLLPQVANQVGWITAEVGRQPYTVYGLLKTSESLSPVVTSGQVLSSIIAFGLVYILLFVLFIYLLNEKIQHGPDEQIEQEGHRA
jgi:cytochrome d ubiquinol oxidase subunit I